MILDLTQEPSLALFNAVRGAYVAKGSSIRAFSHSEGITPQYVRLCLTGASNGKNANSVRKRAIAFAHKLDQSKGA